MISAPTENERKAKGMAEYKCGDCFHADLCEKSKTLAGFSRDNPAYCGMFLNSADVAPVRHGRWIEPQRLYYGSKQYVCSLCWAEAFWDKHGITEKYSCCPNCGAVMEDAE